MARDKITPLAAPPGHSLTDEPGRWPWERPPVYADPDDAIDYITQKLQDDNTREDLLKMMLAGITVEELVNQVSFKGFMGGYYNPDVAELIKPAIGVFLFSMALEEGFEPVMFREPPEEGQVDDVGFFRIMKQRNPEMYLKMNEEINRQQRMQVDDFIEKTKGDYTAIVVEPSESFLDVEETAR
jgi:hypothetical protein